MQEAPSERNIQIIAFQDHGMLSIRLESSEE